MEIKPELPIDENLNELEKMKNLQNLLFLPMEEQHKLRIHLLFAFASPLAYVLKDRKKNDERAIDPLKQEQLIDQ